MSDLNWDLPDPFTIERTVTPADVDEFDHLNNVAYVQWMRDVAWAHSTALGLSPDDCKALDRGMAMSRLQIEYLAPAQAGDTLLVGTWIITNDEKLRSGRAVQMLRQSDGELIARGVMEFACVALSTGAPARMPDAFKRAYAVNPAIHDTLVDAAKREAARAPSGAGGTP